jgi:hypothetical protein
MSILDAFKTGGFAGIGGELGRMLGYGSQLTDLTTAQRAQALSDISVIKGQAPTQTGASLDWYSKTLIAAGVVIIGAVVISKSMK